MPLDHISRVFGVIWENLIFNIYSRSRVVDRAGLFRSGSGLKLTKISGSIRILDVLFVLGAQIYEVCSKSS